MATGPAAGHDAVAYVRVSQVGGRAAAGRLESPDQQRAAIRAWAAARDVRIVEEVQDLTRSGATMTRPGLEQAVRTLEERGAQGLVVAYSSRYARTVMGGLNLIERLAEHGAWVAAADGSIDTTDADRRYVTILMLANDEREHSRASAHLADTRRRAIVEKGRHMGPAPLGYRRAKLEDVGVESRIATVSDVGRLLVDAPHAATVRRVFARRAAGHGFARIAADLAEDGVTDRDGSPLGALQLRRIVLGRRGDGQGSRVFLGEAAHGPHRAVDAHPAILTESEWAAALDPPAALRRLPVQHVHPPSLLSGLLRCAGCRHALKRLPTTPDKPPRWRCRTIVSDRAASWRCEGPASLTGREALELERLVVRDVLVLAGDVAAERRDEAPDVDAARGEVERARELVDELGDVSQVRGRGAAAWARALDGAQRELDDAERQLKAALGQAARVGVTDVAALEGLWQDADVAQRRDLLGGVVQTVLVSGRGGDVAGRVRVVPAWRPVAVPRQGQRGFVVPAGGDGDS